MKKETKGLSDIGLDVDIDIDIDQDALQEHEEDSLRRVSLSEYEDILRSFRND